MNHWLLSVRDDRYRCWEDFRRLGIFSMGHGLPGTAALRELKIGDRIFVEHQGRLMGVGSVKAEAANASDVVLDGQFVAKDGSGNAQSVRLSDVTLERPHMLQDAADPHLGELIVQVAWTTVLPKPGGMLPSRINDTDMFPPLVRSITPDEAALLQDIIIQDAKSAQ